MKVIYKTTINLHIVCVNFDIVCYFLFILSLTGSLLMIILHYCAVVDGHVH